MCYLKKSFLQKQSQFCGCRFNVVLLIKNNWKKCWIYLEFSSVFLKRDKKKYICPQRTWQMQCYKLINWFFELTKVLHGVNWVKWHSLSCLLFILVLKLLTLLLFSVKSLIWKVKKCKSILFKGIVHSKMKIMALFTHVIQTCKQLFFSMKQKKFLFIKTHHNCSLHD